MSVHLSPDVDPGMIAGMSLQMAPDQSYAYFTPIHSPIVSGDSSEDDTHYSETSQEMDSRLGHRGTRSATRPPSLHGDNNNHSWPMRKATDPQMGQQYRLSRSENEAFRERALHERQQRLRAYQRCGKGKQRAAEPPMPEVPPMPQLPPPAYTGKGKERAVEVPTYEGSEASWETCKTLGSSISRVSRRMKNLFSRSSRSS
ncbi:hypothetical protein PRZ48_012581 [Zasmidium cellare]|uniref:Uncharacterized protein n=1 Tax=Zasmidium cellare TaxID=395010 RepID=A0ABR0E5U6_ZASCE|nr:hypothetical protein PRZ48_012581 [Zasmidium cellare]